MMIITNILRGKNHLILHIFLNDHASCGIASGQLQFVVLRESIDEEHQALETL